ncbi:MAG: rRNA small subunit methyltransferase B [Microbacteriaceae bacterium]|nr:rRNA small subunit methyltransferase B [Microbacteriaceae bacterium]
MPWQQAAGTAAGRAAHGRCSVASPRQVALDVLRAVEADDAYANLLLPARIAAAGLDERDAGLATELTYGTLRRRGLYDAVIALAANRPIGAVDEHAIDILRLGVHQLFAMRIPPHAAVGETVGLVQKASARGFVNGVLRTISRTTPEEWIARAVAGARSGEEALAIEHSHPAWVVRALRQVLVAEGREGELEQLLVADNVAPAVSLVALPGLSSLDDLTGAGARAAEYSPVGALLSGGDPTRIQAVAAGRARVQDEGSQLAALALSRARPVEAGERWLDLCAGPGGKAALLAAEAAAGGAALTANELVPARVGLVRKALAPFGDAVRAVEGDGTTFGEREPGAFDRILLDAPCTGLGALRRRPEARWRKQPGDVPGLGELQSRLLDAAIAAVKPGGLVAYVTCSPHAAETKAVVSAALRKHPDVRALDTQMVVRAVAKAPLDLAPGTHVQLWPHRHGTDAMFIQLLERVE